MTAKEVIKNTIDTGHMILTTYIGDLSDDDFFVRTTEGVNHIAWQMGHLISAEHEMMTQAGVTMPDLPDNFAAAYTKETAKSDDQTKFHTKEAYTTALDVQRKATLTALNAMPDGDLDKPTPDSMHEYAPTVGSLFNLLGLHTLMHAPQFVAVRRIRNKPVLI